jgi:hypothetical protein
MAHHVSISTDEQYVFTAGLKRKLFIAFGVGLLFLIVGIYFLSIADHSGTHDAHAAVASAEHGAVHAGGDHGHHYNWMTRIWANIWLNNVYFTGIAVIGVFFFAVQYVANAGWSVIITRVMATFGNYLPIGLLVALIVFFLGGHDLFHWTHESLYIEKLPDGSKNPEYDAIIAGKQGFLNTPFFVGRMVVYFVVWYLLFRVLRSLTVKEDAEGGTAHYYKMIRFSAIFLVFFAVTSSTSAWDWILSIDTHWFSTMFGWYVFASWFVTGLSAITLTIVLLKENGYLKAVNESHLHDLGKFLFGFSIFWTYVWFSQFLLIYYANIPEESIYFVDRLDGHGGYYNPIFFVNIILNFFFPFLALMTRDAKRKLTFLKIVTVVLLFGHFLDFYLMIMPGTVKGNAGFGLVEIGTFLVFGSLFVYLAALTLSKAALIPKNHPLLEESKHHVVY